MTHIAFVTYDALRNLSEDDQLAATALVTRGVTVTPTVWNDPTVAWDIFDAIVVRTTWDYYLAIDTFHAWIDRVEATGVPILNAPALLRWNSHKSYLQDIAQQGMAQIVPTAWIPSNDPRSLMTVLTASAWEEAVVKPAVSAGAHDTWRTNLREAQAHEPRFRALLDRGMVLVQPFLTAITAEGEWSLLFFNGIFSHAVRKVPQHGDFRVQPQYGSVICADKPDDALVRAAKQLVHAVTPLPVYARVDGCIQGGHFLLMELELIEPRLFLASNSEAANRFAKAILETLDQ